MSHPGHSAVTCERVEAKAWDGDPFFYGLESLADYQAYDAILNPQLRTGFYPKERGLIIGPQYSEVVLYLGYIG